MPHLAFTYFMIYLLPNNLSLVNTEATYCLSILVNFYLFFRNSPFSPPKRSNFHSLSFFSQSVSYYSHNYMPHAFTSSAIVGFKNLHLFTAFHKYAISHIYPAPYYLFRTFPILLCITCQLLFSPPFHQLRIPFPMK